MHKIVIILGARPQLIKHAIFIKEARKHFEVITVNTGQHYDVEMNDMFIEELDVSKPEYNLNIGSGSHAKQTAQMMVRLEPILQEIKPKYVVVYGDTNSTLAGALVAAKLNLTIVHIEAGLRSYNRGMPEEINRIITDHTSSYLFCTSSVPMLNLASEGLSANTYLVGDLMKDIMAENVSKISLKNVEHGDYYYTSIHRPYNTDEINKLNKLLDSLNALDKEVIFTLHPRTKSKLTEYKINENSFSQIKFIKPQSYLSNLRYMKESSAVITDSGGMQKEAYWLEKKCLTVRPETEWIETLENGCNRLITDYNDIAAELKDSRKLTWNKELYGLGNTAIQICMKLLNG